MGRYLIRRLLFLLARQRSAPLAFTPLTVAGPGRERPTRLMIVAHPDDESLFGGEALTSVGGWNVVCVTGASNATRREEFTSAMRSIGAAYTMLDHADELHNANFDGTLVAQLASLLAEHPYEIVVTHGSDGEYGHPQHRALHRIVRRLAAGLPVHAFAPAWLARPRRSAAKAALLAHYPSQQRTIARRAFLADRERIRRIR